MSISNFVFNLNIIKKQNDIQSLSFTQIKEKIENLDSINTIEPERIHINKKGKKGKKVKTNKSLRVVTWYSDDSDDDL